MKKIVIAVVVLISVGFYVYAKNNNEKEAAVSPPQTDQKTKRTASTFEGGEFEIDRDKKENEVKELVNRGITFLKKQPLAKACTHFSHSKDFLRGELYLFLFDMQGNCLTHGDQGYLLWKNLWDLKDHFGVYIVRDIINTAKKGGGWITYGWRDATKVSYVQKVEKDGKSYAIGAGYFPHSQKDAVVNLVQGAVAFFNDFKKEGHPKEWAFARMNYPSGQFIKGSLSLFVLDENGILFVQADQPGLVGTNDWNWEVDGKYPNQEIINQLKKTDKGIWVEYVYRGALKKTYAEKIVDKKGKEYFIASGYYPDADHKAAIDLVRRGYQYMKGHGKSAAAEMFTEKREDQFRFGNLYLFVYDMKGNCVAHGYKEDLIGQNLYDKQDQDGRYYIREMIQKAQGGKGWVTAKINNEIQVSYVEKIDIGVGVFFIGTHLFPLSKYSKMTLLVKSGIDFLKMYDREKVFAEMIKPKGNFVQGDLQLLVFDTNGICYAYGDRVDFIWRNLMGMKDDEGKSFIKAMINSVAQGPTTLTYTLNGKLKLSYLESIKKDGKTYVVSSGYFK